MPSLEKQVPCRFADGQKIPSAEGGDAGKKNSTELVLRDAVK